DASLECTYRLTDRRWRHPQLCGCSAKAAVLGNAQERLHAVERALSDCEVLLHAPSTLSRIVVRGKRSYIWLANRPAARRRDAKAEATARKPQRNRRHDRCAGYRNHRQGSLPGSICASLVRRWRARRLRPESARHRCDPRRTPQDFLEAGGRGSARRHLPTRVSRWLVWLGEGSASSAERRPNAGNLR